jgi:hypothetical protein
MPLKQQEPQVQSTYSGLGMNNYKMMKCFYFERDKYCKYGNACQFAHSDRELKTPSDINYLSSLALSINSQLRAGYDPGLTGEVSTDPYTGSYNNYQNANYTQVNGQAYYNYQYQNYPTAGIPVPQAQYDYSSYTPDTNYGQNPPQINSQINTQYPQYNYDPNYQYAYTGGYAYPTYDQNAYANFQYSNPNQVQGTMGYPQTQNLTHENVSGESSEKNTGQISQTNQSEQNQNEGKKINIEINKK